LNRVWGQRRQCPTARRRVSPARTRPTSKSTPGQHRSQGIRTALVMWPWLALWSLCGSPKFRTESRYGTAKTVLVPVRNGLRACPQAVGPVGVQAWVRVVPGS
jgi:hypothetical protein